MKNFIQNIRIIKEIKLFKKYGREVLLDFDKACNKGGKEYCKVIYFPRTVGISTTKLKAILKEGN